MFKIFHNNFVNIKIEPTLAGVAQCSEHWPANQNVASSIPSQGTCLGCGPGPLVGVFERQPIDVSLTHTDASLPLKKKEKRKRKKNPEKPHLKIIKSKREIQTA